MTGRNKVVLYNKYGGVYQNGIYYDYAKKTEVAAVFMELALACFPKIITPSKLSREAKVSWNYANKIINEIIVFGDIIDPEDLQYITFSSRNKKPSMIDKASACHLLSLRAEEPGRPNRDYINELFLFNGTLVSSTQISRFFNSRFSHKGSFCKPTMIPVDKYRAQNLAKYKDFYDAIQVLPNRWRFNYLDECSIVNKQACAQMVRKDPLTGYIPFIAVSGDFRESFQVFACCTPDVKKKGPVITTYRKILVIQVPSFFLSPT